MARFDANEMVFEEISVLGMPALFSSLRINRSTIPSGYNLYEIRHDDLCRGYEVQISWSIMVNHWGSLITRDEIPIPDHGMLDVTPDDFIYGTGDCKKIDDFLRKYPV